MIERDVAAVADVPRALVLVQHVVAAHDVLNLPVGLGLVPVPEALDDLRDPDEHGLPDPELVVVGAQEIERLLVPLGLRLENAENGV